MLFSGGSNPDLAKRVAAELHLELGHADVGRFSDGEVTVEIHENVRGKDVFLLQSTSAPTNDSVMELLIMADALHPCLGTASDRCDPLLRLRSTRPPSAFCAGCDQRKSGRRYDQLGGDRFAY